jgi:hypothetical protein
LVSQKHINLGLSSGANVFDKQYCHDSLFQCVGNYQLHYNDCVPQLMYDLIQVIENIVKQQSSSICVFSSVPSLPLKPLDRRVAIGIDQTSNYVTLQKFTPLTDWSSSTTIKVEAKMVDLESTQHASTFLQWDKGNCYIF